MVDVSSKPVIRRVAIAKGFIRMAKETIGYVKNASIKKGDVFSTSKIAGIMAAKRTPDLIPLCHSLPLDHIDLTFSLQDDGIEIHAQASVAAKTGVEMEALMAVSVAALNIYDMCKAVDKTMIISDIKLIEKRKEDIYNEGI